MIPEIGHFFLWLALGVSLVLGTVPLVGAQRDRSPTGWPWRARARTCWQRCCTLAFACLTVAFVAHDFSLVYVASNSNSALPLHHRVAAVWGGHEGFAAAVGGNAMPVDAGGGAV